MYINQQTQYYDITGLSPYQLVIVTIAATNGEGTSVLSNEVTGRSSKTANLHICTLLQHH